MMDWKDLDILAFKKKIYFNSFEIFPVLITERIYGV